MLYANIKKTFGDFFLDVEFETNKETLALLGASGCGKSMTLKCIAGIETPDEGQIILNEVVLFDSKEKINILPQNRKVGLLFQNYALFPNMTLEKNIAIGVPKNRQNKSGIIKEIIKSFSLEGLENNYPHQLSGGQQQRVALARMLVNDPKILMLDEPFSALDEHLRWQMEQELIDILKKHNGSALYVSHNKDEVYRICDRIAVLNNGKIEETNYKENLFNNPETLNAAMLIGCRNISRIKKVSENKIYAIDWDLELICNTIVKDNIRYVGIHTQNINLCSDYESTINTFKLNIMDIIQNLHSYTLVLGNQMENDGISQSPIYMKTFEEEVNKKELYKGKSIYINLNGDKLLLLH
ncbi:sulfate/molybdate ABC transporter ATP-binding protein [Tissierella carlieri]|uniref:sulfate/molybdate ABC transporter ATP-binding protein n=1 Tax=Tissierella carlieri TaxID=689904 RepID=UPI0030B8F73F